MHEHDMHTHEHAKNGKQVNCLTIEPCEPTIHIDTRTRTDLSLSEVMVALVCCLQREREREGCEGDDYMMRVRKAVHESGCVVGERLWNDDAFCNRC